MHYNGLGCPAFVHYLPSYIRCSSQLHSIFDFRPTIFPVRPNYIHGWSVQGPQKLVAHRSMSVARHGMPNARRGTPEADILVQTERDRPAFHTIEFVSVAACTLKFNVHRQIQISYIKVSH